MVVNQVIKSASQSVTFTNSPAAAAISSNMKAGEGTKQVTIIDYDTSRKPNLYILTIQTSAHNTYTYANT